MWPTIADEAAMDFNEQYKYQLGWIADSKVKTLNSGSGTTYNLKIYACDDPNTLASSTKAGVLAVKFSKDATFDTGLVIARTS